MNVINLTQGTEEWLEFRRTRVTATDFAVISASQGLCENIFKKSINTLISEKITPVYKTSPAMELGKKLEKVIFAELIQTNFDIESGSIITCLTNDRIMASLDAFSPLRKKVIEIKTTSKTYDKYRELIKFYAFQVIHQMFCAEVCVAEMVIFNTLLKSTYTVDIHLFEDVFIVTCKSEMLFKIEMSQEKWLSMCSDFLNKLDVSMGVGFDDANIFYEYFSIKQKIDDLKAILEKSKNQIIEKYQDGVVIDEYKLSRTITSTIGYSEYIKDKKIVVPQEYKKESVVYRLTKASHLAK